jgi:tetratricopeptide (TPR) repeat protein
MISIEHNPVYAEAWNNKGLILSHQNNYEEAIKCYEEAIKSNSILCRGME